MYDNLTAQEILFAEKSCSPHKIVTDNYFYCIITFHNIHRKYQLCFYSKLFTDVK